MPDRGKRPARAENETLGASRAGKLLNLPLACRWAINGSPRNCCAAKAHSQYAVQLRNHPCSVAPRLVEARDRAAADASQTA